MRTQREIEALLSAGKIRRIIGFPSKGQRAISATYILFNDRETILQLEEQDAFTYHDAAPDARKLRVIRDKDQWKALDENESIPDATHLVY